MTQVESVAFWLGFISSIVGIVLSIVAIVFSILVDRRSAKISDHTIQSLQKIESAVERSSSDTRDLIRSGWDKMLGTVDRPPSTGAAEASAKEVAAGIAAELRSELGGLSSRNPHQRSVTPEELEKYLKSFEASLQAQLKPAIADARPSERLDETIHTLRELPSQSFALLRAVTRAHLTMQEYRALMKTNLGPSLIKLRERGLLVPVVHRSDRGDEPCYYMPAGLSRIVRAAMQVLPDPTAEVQARVDETLRSVGYLVDRPGLGGHRPDAPN